jgi:hypothetical protein
MTGYEKNKELVARFFASVRGDLLQLQMFHIDRGKEFSKQSHQGNIRNIQY